MYFELPIYPKLGQIKLEPKWTVKFSSSENGIYTIIYVYGTYTFFKY